MPDPISNAVTTVLCGLCLILIQGCVSLDGLIEDIQYDMNVKRCPEKYKGELRFDYRTYRVSKMQWEALDAMESALIKTKSFSAAVAAYDQKISGRTVPDCVEGVALLEYFRVLSLFEEGKLAAAETKMSEMIEIWSTRSRRLGASGYYAKIPYQYTRYPTHTHLGAARIIETIVDHQPNNGVYAYKNALSMLDKGWKKSCSEEKPTPAERLLSATRCYYPEPTERQRLDMLTRYAIIQCKAKAPRAEIGQTLLKIKESRKLANKYKSTSVLGSEYWHPKWLIDYKGELKRCASGL